MDEDFFLYGEDVDWCKQIWQSGWPVYFVAEGRVIHHEGGSQSSILSRRLRELRGRLQYLRKWHGAIYTFVYQVVVYVCSLYRYFRLQWRQRRTPDNTENLPEHVFPRFLDGPRKVPRPVLTSSFPV